MKALLLNPDVEYSEGYDEKRENYLEVQLLAYDRNKYVLVQLPDGTQDEFKSGYIKRPDNFGYLTYRQLFSLPVLHWTEERIGTRRTKRDVQAELRENYKHKTTFTVYVSNCKKGLDSNTEKYEVPTLKKAIRLCRKYYWSQLHFNTDRFNHEGIAEMTPDDLEYDVNRRNNRPTYSSKALRELSK